MAACGMKSLNTVALLTLQEQHIDQSIFHLASFNKEITPRLSQLVC